MENQWFPSSPTGALSKISLPCLTPEIAAVFEVHEAQLAAQGLSKQHFALFMMFLSSLICVCVPPLVFFLLMLWNTKQIKYQYQNAVLDFIFFVASRLLEIL